MTDSLRNQLLGLGFKPAPKPARVPEHQPKTRAAEPQAQSRHSRTAQAPRKPAKPSKGSPGWQGAARTREDIDLARAYAIRAQREKDERIETERQKQQEARPRATGGSARIRYST